jgi:hypothetical protein
MNRFWAAALVTGMMTTALLSVRADVGPPAHMRIAERESDLFAVQWRVPKALPPRAVPVPAFPEDCRATGDPAITQQPAAWLFDQDWRCESTLAGRPVGLSYPFPDLALTTVIRVDLLSGDRFAHVLGPGEAPWRLPEGTAAPDPWNGASRAVLSGAQHAIASRVHLAFVLAVVLLGGLRRPIRVLSAFTCGQLVGLPVGSYLQVGVAAAEIGLAVVVALLAREALRAPDERRRLMAPAAMAGILHGTSVTGMLAGGLGEAGSHLLLRLLAVLGTDAVHLVAAGAVALVATLTRAPAATRFRGAMAYTVGAAGMALGVGLAMEGQAFEPVVARVPLAPSTPSAGPAAAGSRRLAPRAPDAPVRSFVSVEPFEVRHEVMLRLDGLASSLGLDAGSTIEVSSQSGLTERLTGFVLGRASLRIDGESVPALVRRADFMAVDATGALPRATPRPEEVGDAVVGVIVAYPTAGMPDTVALSWNPLVEPTEIVPATVIDPESVRNLTLRAEEPVLVWKNALIEDPIPTVAAVPVEPTRVPVPWLSVSLLALGVFAFVFMMRGNAGRAATARVVLALAFVVAPFARTTVALPGSAGRTPSERQARRVLAGLLPNIYRSLEFREESRVYDRLAVSVTGQTLAQVYLEQRRTLELEERGGAQARLEAVEIVGARDIEALDRGFAVRAVWTAGGMVTHFGHRHFRQNRYDARIEIVPEAGAWKIRSLDVLEQERIK